MGIPGLPYYKWTSHLHGAQRTFYSSLLWTFFFFFLISPIGFSFAYFIFPYSCPITLLTRTFILLIYLFLINTIGTQHPPVYCGFCTAEARKLKNTILRLLWSWGCKYELSSTIINTFEGSYGGHLWVASILAVCTGEEDQRHVGFSAADFTIESPTFYVLKSSGDSYVSQTLQSSVQSLASW